MRRSNRWEEYCETTFNSLNANIKLSNWDLLGFFFETTLKFFFEKSDLSSD